MFYRLRLPLPFRDLAKLLLAAVVLIHIIGALRHHLLKRNDVLRRMTWGMRA